MQYIADLHIHSPHSRATSPGSTLHGLAAWACIKGIQITATGDFTHPAWFATLRENLIPAEPGLFRLRNEQQITCPVSGRSGANGIVRFMLSAEVSCIYKRHGKVRKVHNLLYVPDFESAARVNQRLAAIGNIISDGRPILGLDSRDLLEIILECAPGGFLVPAHIWTPWFSLFGSRSGFDSVEECFGDLSEHIFALETGLSSDPEMNRTISALDRYALISNSDCHSPSRLGREANLLDTGFDFHSLREAFRSNHRDSFTGTVEFFPEEGKYHFDGHRGCNICMSPLESRQQHGLLCPACGKPMTIGVQHRVAELADRNTAQFATDAPSVHHLIPLQELIAELVGTGPASKEVFRHYCQAISLFGSELALLLHAGINEIAASSPLLAQSVDRVRQKRVFRQPGFDGQFGIIRAFAENELVAACPGSLPVKNRRKSGRYELFRH